MHYSPRNRLIEMRARERDKSRSGLTLEQTMEKLRQSIAERSEETKNE